MEERESRVESFGIQDVFDILYKYRRIIFSVTIGVVAISTLMLLRTTKQYEATCVVKLTLRTPRLTVLPEFPISGVNYDPIESEIEVLRSRSLIANAILKTGANVILKGAKGVEIDTAFSQYPCKFGNYLLEIGNDETVTLKDYSGKVIDSKKLGEWLEGEGFKFVLKKEKSQTVKPQTFHVSVFDPMRRLTGVSKIDIRRKGATDLVTITLRTPSPYKSANLANAIGREYIKYTLQSVQEEAQTVKSFIEEQLVTLERELEEFQNELQKFKKETGIYELSQTANLITTQLTYLESEMAKSLTSKRELELLMENIREELMGKGFIGEYKELFKSPDELLDPLAKSLREKLISLEIERSSLLATYGELHPKVVSIDKSINQIKEELKKIYQRMMTKEGPYSGDPVYQKFLTSYVDASIQLYAVLGRIRALEPLIKNYKSQLLTLPEKEFKLAELTRKVQVTRDVYSMLLNKLQEAKIAEAGKVSDAKIIDPAIPIFKPVVPRPQRDFLVSTLLGLILGIVIALLMELLDNSVKKPEQIEEIIGAPNLATIPLMEGVELTKVLGRNVDLGMITHLLPKSHYAEQFRSLRTSIKFVGLGNIPKNIVISSSSAKEGKTTILSNLGIAFAQIGVRTILVDTDLRNPMLHKIFDIEKDPGFVDVIMGKCDLTEAIRTIPDIPNLYVLTSGPIPPNPQEILTSYMTEKLINQLSDNFDVVLFDSPPILPAFDAIELSTKCDGMILVVQAGVTQVIHLREVKKILDSTHVRVLGTILNALDYERHYGYYKYRYYRYYRYYKYGYPYEIQERSLLTKFLNGTFEVFKKASRKFLG